MASLFKRPRSKFWFAAFTDENGRRLKKSTKTTDKRTALRIADAFENAANKRRTYLQVRRVLGDFSRELLGVEMREPTFREHVDAWLTAKRPSNAPSTSVFYRNATSKFLKWLGERADKEISRITSADITSFRNHRATSAAPKTVNHEIKVLRMVFRAARKEGVLADDPAEFVDVVRDKSKDRSRRPFSVEELRTVLAACDPEWRSLVIFGFYTGQRLGDLATLKWASIGLEQREISLTTQKTQKKMAISISPALAKHILELSNAKASTIFVHPDAARVVERTGKTGGLSNQFSDILARAGLRKKKAHRATGEGRGAARDESGLSFHSLRHTAVSMMKDANIPAAAVMEMIGHDSEQMSQHYTHVGREALRKAADSLPDVTT